MERTAVWPDGQMETGEGGEAIHNLAANKPLKEATRPDFEEQEMARLRTLFDQGPTKLNAEKKQGAHE